MIAVDSFINMEITMTTNTKSNQPKIGIVDIPFLVNHTPSVAVLRQEQAQKAQALHQWVNAANAQIAQEQNQENKKALAQKYQLEFNQRQQMLQVEHAQKVQSVDAELTKLIADVAKKEKLDYVFAKGIVVYGGIDITEKVVDALKK